MNTKFNVMRLLAVVLMSMAVGRVMAYDIEVANDDKVPLYYNYINDGRELEVTYKVRGEGPLTNPPSLPEGFLSGYDGQTEVNVPGEVTYMGRTRKVTAVSDFAFYHSDILKKVILPTSVKAIGVGAFALCDSLKTVEGFEYASSLKWNMFYLSQKLETVKLSEELTEIPTGLFHFCNSLKEIAIPASVKDIRSGVFSGCTALKEVTFAEGLETIGSNAFRECSSLAEITLPESLTQMGNGVFTWCKALKQVRIPSKVTTLPPSLFNHCPVLEKVELPEGLTKIDIEAFYCCGALSSVNLPSTLEEIGKDAFFECMSLTDVEMPSNIRILGDRAFYWTGITTLAIPPSLKTIGASCFGGCKKLASVEFSEGLEEIGSRAFYFPTSQWEPKLKEVVLPSTLKSLGEKAFENSVELTAVTFKGATAIGNDAFISCPKLVTVTSYAMEPVAFTGKDEQNPGFTQDHFFNATLNIPYGTTETYKATNGWKDFIWMEEMEPTGISPVHSSESIIHSSDNTVYDLQGRRVADNPSPLTSHCSPLKKSIYIVAGKKVVM